MKLLNYFLRHPWDIGHKIGSSCIPDVIKYKKNDPPSIEEIGIAVQTMDVLDYIRKNDQKTFLEMPYLQFMMATDLLKIPGELIESYFCRDMDKINPSLENGDRAMSNGYTFQFKVSEIWASKRNAMFRRIQIWQNVDEYRMVIIDKQNNYRPYFYSLTKEQMSKEMLDLNAIPHNSTKIANESNNCIPYSFCLRCVEDNIHFQRWQNNYRREDLEIPYVEKINCEIQV